MTYGKWLFAGVISLWAYAAVAQPITHTPFACVPANGQVRVVVQAADATSVRLYFSAVPPSCGEHYIDMRRSSDSEFWAVLPIPDAGITSVVYRFESRSSSGTGAAGPFTATVDAACGAPALDLVEQQVASNLVVGMTKESQANRLCGFRCEQVGSVISASGQLLPYDGCGAWSSAKKVRVWGEFMGAGAILGYLLSDDDDPQQVSPVRP